MIKKPEQPYKIIEEGNYFILLKKVEEIIDVLNHLMNRMEEIEGLMSSIQQELEYQETLQMERKERE